MKVYEVYWPSPTESFPHWEYQSAGASGYGQSNNMTGCLDFSHGHFCYSEAESAADMMRIASLRHAGWRIPPVWLGTEWWKQVPRYVPRSGDDE